MKNILITGSNSYIGESVRDYLLQWPEEYKVVIKDTIDWKPLPKDFWGFDVVFNVAGIAHIKETKENKRLFFEVNRNLIARIAKTAKMGGVKQFINLSSMSVYGCLVGHITKETPIHPVNAYGKSKAQADKYIMKIEDDSFKYACLRPPMIYGRGCKGNYQSLRKFALKSPVFPNYKNERSMLFIGNLNVFIKDIIDAEKSGVFFPQNYEYVNTGEMVKLIAKAHGKTIIMTRAFNWLLNIVEFGLFKKVFGSLTYEDADRIKAFSFEESIKITERG